MESECLGVESRIRNLNFTFCFKKFNDSDKDNIVADFFFHSWLIMN